MGTETSADRPRPKRVRKHRTSTLARTDLTILPIPPGKTPRCLRFADATRIYGIGVAHRMVSAGRLVIRSARRKAREVN